MVRLVWAKSIFISNMINPVIQALAVLSLVSYTVLDKYGVSYSICSNIAIGEDAGNINNGLLIAINELETEYEKDISLFLKASMWIGQISMIVIAMKPMIDIMLLVSIGPLNFKI